MEQYVFWPTALLSLASAIIVVGARNAVHSALALVLNLFTLAIFYLLLDAEFLAVTQIIIYAGAVMVLFLFVLMLLGVDRAEDLTESLKGQRSLAWLLALVLVGVTVFTLRVALEAVPFTGLENANAGGNVEGLGRLLFTRYLLPFEVAGLLLLVGAIGAMVIGKRRASHRMDAEEDES